MQNSISGLSNALVGASLGAATSKKAGLGAGVDPIAKVRAGSAWVSLEVRVRH